MAESWRAKANRYARGEFTNTELKVLLGGMVADQIIDVATYGRLSKLKAQVLAPIVRKAVPIAGRAALRTPLATAGSARYLALKHPVATGLAVAYVAYTERDKIQALLEQGYEIIEPAVEPVGQFLREQVFTEEHLQRGRERGVISPPAFLDPLREKLLGKRKPSKFNLAVKAGMKAIKKSTSYGGKGIIKPAKKAFALVTKLASAKKKKKKAPKSGIRRRIWNAMKGLR